MALYKNLNLNTISIRRNLPFSYWLRNLSFPRALACCLRLRTWDVRCEAGHSIDRDTLAERSEAVAQGAIPKGRGFEPHRCHFCGMGCDHMCMYMCMMYLITDFHFHLTIFEAYQTHRERTRYSYEKQLNHNIILDPRFTFADDTLAERLRRRPAKPMGSPRVGSNPTGVVLPSSLYSYVLA